MSTQKLIGITAGAAIAVIIAGLALYHTTLAGRLVAAAVLAALLVGAWLGSFIGTSDQ